MCAFTSPTVRPFRKMFPSADFRSIDSPRMELAILIELRTMSPPFERTLTEGASKLETEVGPFSALMLIFE